MPYVVVWLFNDFYKQTISTYQCDLLQIVQEQGLKFFSRGKGYFQTLISVYTGLLSPGMQKPMTNSRVEGRNGILRDEAPLMKATVKLQFSNMTFTIEYVSSNLKVSFYYQFNFSHGLGGLDFFQIRE